MAASFESLLVESSWATLLRATYDFSKGVRGKHAAPYAAGTNVVAIGPDVAAEFPTAEEVNETLRAVARLLQRHRKATKKKTA
jgi:hypothetical protein